MVLIQSIEAAICGMIWASKFESNPPRTCCPYV